MIAQASIFKQDPSHIFDFGTKTSGQIFNEHILPKTEEVTSLVPPEEAPQQPAFNPFEPQSQAPELVQPTSRPQAPQVQGENYDAPIASPVEKAPAPVEGDLKIKLSNYGYESDSSPDYNSNTLKIGHANNPLESGKSAALTKSLAERYGLKTGDMFEALTASGETLRRRYDDTVPTKYRGRRLPETVDLYDVNGNNNFAGVVTGIRPLSQ